MNCTQCGATVAELIPDYAGCAECAPITDRAALLYATARARLVAAEEICDALAGMKADLKKANKFALALEGQALLKDMLAEAESRTHSVAALRAIFEEGDVGRIEALWGQAVADSNAAEKGADDRRRRHTEFAASCCRAWGLPWPPEAPVEPEVDGAGMLAALIGKPKRGAGDPA